MKRRQFVSSVAVLGLPGTAVLAGDRSLLADCKLITFLGDDNSIKRLGRLYRERFPAEADADALARSLQSVLMPDMDAFAEVITGDFAAGNTVRLEGWVLSRTEARQAALYSILHS